MRQTMRDDQQEFADRLQPLLSYKQDLLRTLVEERPSEHVLVVVVWRQRGGQEEGDVGGVHGASEEAYEEDAEAVDDKLARRDAVDVKRGEFVAEEPLGILDVDEGVGYSTWVGTDKITIIILYL